MSTSNVGDRPSASNAVGTLRDVPIDWEALEDAFENNAPEVHSYLHLATGEVLRVVEGIADPKMLLRIASDGNYLRIDPVSSREQYRWMERFIPMVENAELRARLTQAIDGKGAFRRFKDVLMTYAEDRERWFAFRSERLRTFMEAWLSAHAIKPVERPQWPAAPGSGAEVEAGPPESTDEPSPKSQGAHASRRGRSADSLREQLKELGEALGPRDLETVVAFAEFLKARRAARSFAHHHEHMMQERATQAGPTSAKNDDERSS